MVTTTTARTTAGLNRACTGVQGLVPAVGLAAQAARAPRDRHSRRAPSLRRRLPRNRNPFRLKGFRGAFAMSPASHHWGAGLPSLGWR